MADPRNELADIVVPAAPEAVVASAGSSLALWAAVVGVLVACVVLAAWLWHRRRSARALHAIVAAAQRQGNLPTLAARLDDWVRKYFQLTRVDAARCPPGLDPAGWSDWVTTLEQLRFAQPQPDGFVRLFALCRTARSWRRRV
jgi:hypothetical protein